MITRNCVLMDRPTDVGLKGVECYCLIESKIYQQMTGPQGSRWVAVGSNVVMSGQMLVSFLFGENQKIDTEGSIIPSIIDLQFTAFVASYGVDETAAVGDMSKPYLTLQGALDGLRDLVLNKGIVVALTTDADITITNFDINSGYPYHLTIDYTLQNENPIFFNGGTMTLGNATFIAPFGISVVNSTIIIKDDFIYFYCGDFNIATLASINASTIECRNYYNEGTVQLNKLIVKDTYSSPGTTTSTTTYRTVLQGIAVGDVPTWDGSDYIPALPLATPLGYYLSISDSTDQTNPTANTPRAVKFNTIDLANGFSLQTETAVFTGTINNGGAGAGTILNVTGVASGTLKVGMVLTGGSITVGTFISAFTSGTGGIGTYEVSVSQNRASATYTGTMTSEIVCANTGVYNIQFSSQMDKSDAGVDYVNFWLRKNGADIPESSGVISLQGAAPAYMMAAWNYLVQLVAGDVIELYWGSADVNMEIIHEPAQISPFAHPSIQSTILTITQQSGILAGTFITAINSLTGSVQTMVSGTSGTDFAINSTGSAHTFNLPTASASNRGALSSADWTTFNGKQNALGYTPENVSNKATDLTSPDNIKYPTTLAVSNALASAGVTINKTMALIAAY